MRIVMRIVVTGAKGKLGGFLCRDWGARHEVCALSRDEVDLCDGEALRRRLEGEEFDVLVNCAAMASPEDCEDHPEVADLVNVVAPRIMADVCAERGARMVHFSTDYVVDGREEGLKSESVGTEVEGYYERSKLAGEEAVLASHPGALVCRVSWIFGKGVPSFLETVVERARGGEGLSAVADKWSKPTSAADISMALERILMAGEVRGILHLVNEGDPVSWWDYACRVVALAREAGLLEEEPEVERGYLAEMAQLRAPRPVHTALGSDRLEGLLGSSLPHWEVAAAAHLREMAERECH